jgi:hypothetical protein
MNTKTESPDSTENNPKRRVSILLIVIALIGLGYIFRDKPQILEYPPGSEVQIFSPSGASEEYKRLHARLIKDVTDFYTPSRKNPLLFCGDFKPDGATFPDGVEVVFPMAEALPPQSTLWIVNTSAEDKKWVGTGESAKVDSNGRTATGRVYHFSYIGLAKKQIKRVEKGHIRRPNELHIPEPKLNEFQKALNESVRRSNEVLRPVKEPKTDGYRKLTKREKEKKRTLTGTKTSYTSSTQLAEEFDWGQTLPYAAYIYHVTKTHTYSGSFDRDMYLCHKAANPDANGQIHDRLGHYQASRVAGPLTTPRAICEAYRGLDPAKGRAPGGWAGVNFNCGAYSPK